MQDIKLFFTRLKRLRPYFEKTTGAVIAIILATVLMSLTEPAIPALLQPLLDKGFVNNNLALWKVPLGIIGLFGIRGLFGFLAQYFLAVISNQAMQKLRTALFGKLLRIEITSLQKHTSSYLANTIVHEIQTGTSQLVSSLLSILRDGLTLIALLSYLLYLNWALTIIVFTIIPSVAFIMKFFSARLVKIAHLTQKTTDDLCYIVEENVLAQRMVRLHNAQKMQYEKFDALSAKLRRLSIKSIAGGSAMTPLTQMMAAIALSIVICIALWQKSYGVNFSVGGFASFVTAMLMLIAPIKHLSEATTPLIRGLVSVERGLNFIDENNDEPSGELSAPTPINTVIKTPIISFRNIKLRYKDSDGFAINDLSLDISKGQKIAFVGTSGSGKSSLINLLPRFLDVTEGAVYVADQLIQNWNLKELRQQFGYVSQDVVLLNDTLAANVALGDESPDIERIYKALYASHLEELITNLAKGIYTTVGHNAIELSGGQRQRLAIARAIYKNSPVLLLDEATSALDNESERIVQQALDKLMQDRTTLVVAHRLSTVQTADHIVVMGKGRILEQGTHHALLLANGHYSRLYQLGLAIS